ncbi:PadR family transcriptional regulator [Paractinoplanes globisporus]|uniref:PadR family transcriptional regulator n=1 Tax=Paractinoplanes globisporus TaxID=113565 RepID=A0ABW6WCR3_9ACTN|nr:PadR family transcriptional regulator [Actinoplanes globisporus]
MKRNRSPSPQVVRVMHALAAEPSRWRYGYDLGAEVDLKSGSLYPILVRLADRGLLEATWEPGPPGKPARHLYRLTAAGLDQVAQLATEAVAQRPPVPHRRWKEA